MESNLNAQYDDQSLPKSAKCNVNDNGLKQIQIHEATSKIPDHQSTSPDYPFYAAARVA